MELIFENVAERDRFFENSYCCPGDCGGKEIACCNLCGPTPCKKCWEQSGVKYRVREAYNGDDVIKRFGRIKKLYDTVCNVPGFKECEYEWILGEGIIDHLKNSGFNYKSLGSRYKTLMGIIVAVDYDYPLRVGLGKLVQTPAENQPTPDHPVPIEEQKGCYTEIVINEPLRPGDRLVKKDGKFYVKKRPEPKVILTTHNPYLNVSDLVPNFEVYYSPRQCGKTEMYRQLMEELGKLRGDRHSDSDKLDALTYSYQYTKWRETLDMFMDKHDHIKKPQIEKVIFNNPATIVFWKDGTKTVVKCQDGDKFDEEKGLAMAICKKVYGEGYWTGVFKKWVPEKKVRSLADVMKEMTDHITMAFGVPAKILEDLPHAPIPSCGRVLVSEPLKPCEECKHSDVHEFDEPCRSCSGNSGFEEKRDVNHTCITCKYTDIPSSHEPCRNCVTFSRYRSTDNWTPRDAK